VRSSKRVAVVAALGLSCLLALGAVCSTAGALTAKQKAIRVRVGIRDLQVTLQSYSIDNGDLYPRFTSNPQFRALLTPWVYRHWPINPYSGRSMRNKRSAGNFTYATYANLSKFRLIGWGPHGRRILVAP